MNLVYPYSIDRFHGAEIPITSPEQFVPLFVTGETPVLPGWHKNPSDFGNVPLNNMVALKFPAPLVQFIANRREKEIVMKAVRDYLKSVFCLPELKSYVTSFPLWIHRLTYNRPGLAGRMEVFSGAGGGDGIYEGTRILMYRKGLLVENTLRNTMSDYTIKTAGYPQAISIPNTGAPTFFMEPDVVVVVQAKYIDYIRVRNTLGLPMKLPFTALKILTVKGTTNASIEAKVGPFMKDWLDKEEKSIEFVEQDVLHSYLYGPKLKGGPPSYTKGAPRKQYLENVKREMTRYLTEFA